MMMHNKMTSTPLCRCGERAKVFQLIHRVGRVGGQVLIVAPIASEKRHYLSLG